MNLLKKFLVLTFVATFFSTMSVQAKADVCEGYNYTKCPTGYAAVSSEMCLSGKTKKYKCESCAKGYFKIQGICIKKLNCKNGGYQEYDVCICPEGWTGTSCQTAVKCPYTTKNCASGYHETGNTCKSGKNIYAECEADVCEGYNYTKCPTGYAAVSSEMCLSGKTKKYKCETCAKGYFKSNGVCVKDLKCKNGGYQEHDVCICPEGWTGTSCQTAAKCSYTTKACVAGYHETGNTCKSGKNIYVECEADVCEGYNYTKCSTGYAAVSSEMCLSGKTKKYKCESCAKGYFKIQGICIKKLNCKNGGYQEYDVCICPEGWTGTSCQTAVKCPYTTKNCASGYHETGNTCKSGKNIYAECEADVCEGYNYTKCPTGYAAVSSEMCLSGKTKKYKCETCAKGYVMHKGVCMGNDLVGKKSNQNNRNNIIIDNAINRNIYGLMKIGDTIYGNNGGNLNQKTLNSYISITNHGHGDVYGMYGNSNIYGNISYNSSGSELTNNIDITNQGHGDVYGIYSVQSDYNGDVYGNRVSGESINTDLTNDVSITNHGNGNIYGMRGNSSLSGNELYNSSNNNLTNTINITNQGDGYVYGMYGKFVSGNKVFDNSIGNNLTNTINITNQGPGNVYGMYGESVSGNDTWEADNNLTNIINITNHGDGNVYGMKGKYADNYSNENQTSVIEIVNTGDGLAVGMYATTNAENTGDITIHNIATGTAVGIIVDAEGTVTNSSTITIDREAYTNTKGTSDTTDDETYIAGTSKGGVAIGIYGGKNSNITNTETGKIIINDAENAYGIYAEAGSSVTNNGQIIIDGNENSKNAIKLNRGKLFQDGKLIVGASHTSCADGYIEQDGVCYKKLSCPENSTQQTNVCVCNDGYIEQDSVCYKKLSCPENFTQQANVCVCNDGYIEQDGVCYKKLSCPENSTQQTNVCVCNDGYIEQDGICYRELSCPENSTQQANTCVCNDGYIEQDGVCYKKLSCQQNAHQVQDTCDCNRGYILIDGKCQRVGTNWSKNNYSISIFNDDNSDVYGLYAEDEYGYADAYNAYNTYGSYPETGTIDITNTGDGYVYGVYSALNYAFNAYVSYSYGKAFGTINITNEGNGDVYVLYADEAYNAYASGKNSSVTGTINITNNGYGDAYGVYSALNSAYNAYTYDGSVTGTINITNNGYGNVYAVYSALNSAFNAYGSDNATGRIYITNNGYGDAYGIFSGGEWSEAYNAYESDSYIRPAIIDITNNGLGYAYGVYANGKYSSAYNAYGSYATGTIDITNNGLGDVYGVYGDEAINASADGENNTATGTINITNTGDGDIYGVYAVRDAYNAYASGEGIASITPKSSAHGSIYITNNGYGDAYGVYSHNFVSNAAATSSLGNGYGYIDITNTGNGNVYGLYSDYSAMNATKSGNASYTGIVRGTINIKNSGLGNAYGLYSAKYAFNDTEKDNNVGNSSRTSIIEMVNAGNGLAVGMRATNTASNSGDITIHNLAEGTAVGIMVDADGTATNSGTITIDHEDYTDTKGTEDTSDDITYIAGTEKGGLSIGIYGGENSKITNTETGTIIINGASEAYGIYAEAGSSVTNNGQIIIDGVEYGEDAIKLNRGTLFQDGKLIVGEKYGNCIEGYIFYNGKCYKDLGGDNGIAYKYNAQNNGIIAIEYFDKEDLYGLYYTLNSANAHAFRSNSTAIGTIDITNSGEANVYGMYSFYSSACSHNAAAFSLYSTATGTLNITNTGNGYVYGVYGFLSTYNATASEKGVANGIVNITNTGNGDVYGLYSRGWGWNAATSDSNSRATGTINITNTGDGDVYGLYTVWEAYNTFPSDSNSRATGTIDITNTGDGDVYGLYTDWEAYNTYASGEGVANGTINIKNIGNGNAYGMKGNSAYNTNDENQTSVIEMVNAGNGLAVGMQATSYAENSGDITIHNLADGTAVGIMVDAEGTAINSGTITIDRESYTDTKGTDDTTDDVTYIAGTSKGGLAIGIYGGENSTITNDTGGKIIINGASEAYGIYAESGSKVTNNGQIIIDGVTNGEKAIKLNDGALFQDGKLIVASEPDVAQYALDVASVPLTTFATDSEPISSTNLDTKDLSQEPISKPNNQRAGSLNLDDFDGTVIASKTSQFIVEGAISGNLAINNNVVTDGFDTVYRVSDMIDAADSSELNLISQSAMFEASLENGTDAVMTMKSFDEVINNKSFAKFLENNYALENNENFFSNIKTVEDVASLNKALNQMFGKNMFSRFAFEDLMLMRELNFDINNNLFNNKEDYMSIGGNTSSFAFSGNSRYSLTSNNFGNYSVGLSIAFSDINSDDGNDENLRSETMYNISTPVGYYIKGLEFITTPRIGYAYGTYNRNGFNNQNYEGTVKKQMFALMNETRYPFEFGGWKIAPSAEFNLINYHISGDETDKEYSLKIKSQNNYSVEAGIGLYASKENELTKDTSIKFNAGVSIYHEFADPYKMKLGMEGMSSSFTLRDETHSDNRAVVQSKFEFKHNNMSLIGNIASYIDRKYETDARLDFRFEF